MKKWKANEMKFVQIWNNNRYEPEVRNYTRYTMIYRTPEYCSYGDEHGGSDNGETESMGLAINVEEGIVFLEETSQARNIFENENEIALFVQSAQQKFDTEIDMGKGTTFIYGYGGSMASLKEYDNPNIQYIPLVFPDNEKFNNPRYKEKVESSLIEKGAIFISRGKNDRYLAVVQRKNKPRDLSSFKRFLQQEEQPKKVHLQKEESLVTITFPKWLGKSLDIQTESKEISVKTSIEKETDKAVLIKHKGKSAWLPKSKIKIG